MMMFRAYPQSSHNIYLFFQFICFSLLHVLLPLSIINKHLKDGFIDVPVILVGNKIDQFNDRMISTEEGQKRSKEIACACFHEISVRESIEQVIIFHCCELFIESLTVFC